MREETCAIAAAVAPSVTVSMPYVSLYNPVTAWTDRSMRDAGRDLSHSRCHCAFCDGVHGGAHYRHLQPDVARQLRAEIHLQVQATESYRFLTQMC